MNFAQLEAIVAAILAAGAGGAGQTPEQAVDGFKAILDHLRKSGGIPPGTIGP